MRGILTGQIPLTNQVVQQKLNRAWAMSVQDLSWRLRERAFRGQEALRALSLWGKVAYASCDLVNTIGRLYANVAKLSVALSI